MRDKLHYLPRLGMGEAQRLYGLTARALRFYEERGLVVARRDTLNCRYFDGEARRRLGWISALRAAGVPLADVEAVLQAEEESGRGQDAALEKLEARRRSLSEQLAQVDELSTTLRAGGGAEGFHSRGLSSAA